MMKIGLVCPYDMFKGGGVQSYVLELRRELERRGHQAKVIAPLPRDSDGQHPDGVIFVGDARDMHHTPLHTVSQISVSMDTEELEELLEQEQFDILHFHEPWVPILSRQILIRSRAVNIATFHAKLPETAAAKALEKVSAPYTKSILKYLDVLTAVSPAAAEYLQSLTDEPVVIIPNGIDLQRYRPAAGRKSETWTRASRSQPNLSIPLSHRAMAMPGAPETKDTKTILFIGRLEKRKGVSCLLEAFRQLKQTHPEVRLLIAGDGPERERLEAHAQEYALPDVQFLGYIDDDTKLQLLQTADLFCSPALYGESFGIVLIEAMACGTVTVAGNNPGYASVLQGEGERSLVNPKDTVALANRLEVMLYDADMRRAWQSWALQYVKQFDYPKIVDQYEALYLNAHKRVRAAEESRVSHP